MTEDEKPDRKFPFSDIPEKKWPLSDMPKKDHENWWKTLPGQASILVLIGGVIVILCGMAGIIGPKAPY